MNSIGLIRYNQPKTELSALWFDYFHFIISDVTYVYVIN